MNNRICQIKVNNEWKEIKFKDLKEDDIFRLFESTGEQVFGDNNQTEFIASSNAFLNEDDIWSVNILG